MISSFGSMSRSRALRAAVRSLFSNGELGVWYDPSDLGTLFQDSAGTTPVTAVTQPVGKILDKSGNGYHATQVTSTARPTLQVDANGKYYLKFDGVDDFMVTPSINFSSTDKMSVFAGVRKLSDAARGIIVEMSTSYASNGAFGMDAPNGVANNFGFGLGGNVTNAIRLATPFGSPISAVLTGIFDFSGTATNSEILPRINGSTPTLTDALVTGNGNFGNFPLYIGMRAGTTLPFNGHLYGIVIRGALSDAAQISATEAYINSRTGAY